MNLIRYLFLFSTIVNASNTTQNSLISDLKLFTNKLLFKIISFEPSSKNKGLQNFTEYDGQEIIYQNLKEIQFDLNLIDSRNLADYITFESTITQFRVLSSTLLNSTCLLYELLSLSKTLQSSFLFYWSKELDRFNTFHINWIEFLQTLYLNHSSTIPLKYFPRFIKFKSNFPYHLKEAKKFQQHQFTLLPFNKSFWRKYSGFLVQKIRRVNTILSRLDGYSEIECSPGIEVNVNLMVEEYGLKINIFKNAIWESRGMASGRLIQLLYKIEDECRVWDRLESNFESLFSNIE